MHTPAGKDDAAFQREFERILDEAETASATGRYLTTYADFTGFVFPSANYAGRKFKAHCVFTNSTFTQAADFSHANFEHEAEFYDVRFTQQANFGGTVFEDKANFLDAIFSFEADFQTARFKDDAYFYGAKFMKDVNFRGTKFTRRALFVSAEFLQDADFGRSGERNDEDRKNCVFAGPAEFGDARFAGTVGFRRTEFRYLLDGNRDPLYTFSDRDGPAGADFSGVKFEKPEEVTFYQTRLDRALFHNCDVSRVRFSDVSWRKRASGRSMVFDEAISPQNAIVSFGGALKPTSGDNNNPLNYRLIAELYQRLKRNYDEQKDYWTAGDFHYGEMEMKRLYGAPRTGWFGRYLDWPLRLLHKYFGLIAWYKYCSQYGESYMRPFFLLLIVLAVFTLLFPLAGLIRNDTPRSAVSGWQQAPPLTAVSELSYRHFDDFVRAYPGRDWIGPAAFFGNSLMTVLSVAGFQKELKYEPGYPWGRALALLELLLTSTLVGLFLLAVRRQFKR